MVFVTFFLYPLIEMVRIRSCVTGLRLPQKLKFSGVITMASAVDTALALTDSASAFVDPLIYIASHPDLIRALGNDPLAGLRHYRDWGYDEGRVTSSFNPAQYLANYADLRAS